MSESNGRRVAHKTLGKLLALGALAGIYCLATVGAAGLMMAATDMSAQARGGHGGGGHGGGPAGATVVVTFAGAAILMAAVISPAGVAIFTVAVISPAEVADTSGAATGMATA